MKRLHRYRRGLSAFAAFLALLSGSWTGVAAAASNAGVEAATAWCGRLSLDPERIERNLDRIFAAASEHAPEPSRPPLNSDHECPACFFGKAVALPPRAPAVVNRLAAPHRVRFRPCLESAAPQTPSGPPVGSRAPPSR